MDAKQFEKIETKIKERISFCEFYLGPITREFSIKNMTLTDVAQMRNFCKEEKVIQTNILMVDLYHIIGMGNLTVVQLSKLVQLIKTYASYRPDIKAIANWDGNIELLPDILKKTKFKLLEFGSLTMFMDRVGDESAGDYVEETETKNEFNDTRDEKREAPISIGRMTNNLIYLKKDEINNFTAALVTHKFFSNLNTNSVAAAIISQKMYGGFRWTKENDFYVGFPSNPKTIEMVRQLYFPS